MIDEKPENAEAKSAKAGPRETLADDLIRAEFAELSRTRGCRESDDSKESATESASVEEKNDQTAT